MDYPVIYGVSLLDDLHNFFPDLLYNNNRFTNVQDVFAYMNLILESRFNSFNYGRNVYQNRYHRTRAGPFERQVPTVNTTTTTNTTTNAGHNRVSRTNVSSQHRINPVRQVSNSHNTSSPAPGGSHEMADHAPASTPNVQRRTLETHTQQTTPEQPRIISATYSIFPQTNREIEEISIEGMLPGLLSGQIRNHIPNIYADDNFSQRILNQVDQYENQSGQFLNDFFGNSPISTLLYSMLQSRNNSWVDPVVVRPSATEISRATSLTSIDNTRENERCVICQDDMNNTHVIRRINQCRHQFHQNCLDQHFQNSVRCPICRYDIRQYNNQSESQAASQAASQATRTN